MLLWESTPAKWKTKIQIQYQLQKIRLKKEKPRLLTEQEFIDQSQLETTRALQDLGEYCKSPKCDAWKMTSRLTSPSRFAEFVAGTTWKYKDVSAIDLHHISTNFFKFDAKSCQSRYLFWLVCKNYLRFFETNQNK